MNEITQFSFEGSRVRTIVADGLPQFVARDVASVLGYARTADAVRKHVDAEDKGVAVLETPGGRQNLTTITESGVYSLIMSSKLPNAKRFKRWVTSEVLPSIRKDGAYLAPKTAEEWLNNPDLMIDVLTRYKQSQKEVQRLHDENAVMAPKADYTDKMLLNPGLETTSMIAKNYGYSAVQFNRLLYGFKIQFRQGDTWVLYSKYQDKGYTHIKPYEYTNSDGVHQVRNTMKWTQRGAKFLYDFLADRGIRPKVEQLGLEEVTHG
ncbi:phage antirepressor protein [Lactobacillus sp. PFC-70]|nr:phage antirepressor protein [Lactobacillus sp. PFC-70]